MEILTETALWSEHLFFSILTCGIAITLAFVAVISIKDTPILSAVALIALLATSPFIFLAIKSGPVIEYTAIVTDYNEVFSQGYEIIRHEGKLVILTKESR